MLLALNNNQPCQMSNPSSHKRLVSVDVLRAIAALAVLISHDYSVLQFEGSAYYFDYLIDYGNRFFLSIFRGGAGGGNHPGVVVFIVLSGFCIHGTLARDPERANSPFFWRRYFVRRFFRIYPVYLFGTAFGATLLYFMQNLALSPDIHGTQISPTSLLAKCALLGPLFPGLDPGSGNVPLETVATEMWLYAFYPILYLVALRSVFAAAIIVTFFYILSVAALYWGFDPVQMYSTFPRFLLYWVMGAVVAHYFYRKNTFAISTLSFSTTASFIALQLANQFLDVKGGYLIRVPLMAFFSAMILLLLLTVESRRQIINPLFSLLAWIGERSYSLYVVHMPIVLFVWGLTVGGLFTVVPVLGPRFLAFALSLGAMLFVYRRVESPSHRYAHETAAKIGAEAA